MSLKFSSQIVLRNMEMNDSSLFQNLNGIKYLVSLKYQSNRILSENVRFPNIVAFTFNNQVY